jgi:hypothetical protein
MANKLGSENIFPIIRILEDATPPSTPPTGQVHFYVDEATKTLHGLDDAAVDTDYGAAAGSVATDAIWDAAGDLAVGSGANTAAKLTAGSEDDVLTIVSGVPAWAPPAAAGSGALTLIGEDIVVGSAAAQLNVTGIPNTYRDLVIVIMGRSSQASAVEAVVFQVGDGAIDTASNYRHHRDSTGTGNVAVNSTSVTSVSAGMAVGANGTANNVDITQIEIINYAVTTFWRRMLTRSVHHDASRYLNTGQGTWMNAADEIERVRATLSAGSWVVGSRMTVYGRS